MMAREITMHYKVIETFNYSNFARIEVGKRALAILVNSLCHSISKQKFELMHVRKVCKNCEWLNYPQLIDKLSERSEEFRDIIELYNSLTDTFFLGDPANVRNPDYLWRRKSRK